MEETRIWAVGKAMEYLEICFNSKRPLTDEKIDIDGVLKVAQKIVEFVEKG